MTPTERARREAIENAVLDREANETPQETLREALTRIAKTKRTKGASNG